MLDIAAVTIIVLVIWALTAVVVRRSPSWQRGVLVVLLGLALTAGVGKALLELMSSRRIQLFGEMITRVETNEPIIALTFDDGPSAGYTEPVLDLLREYDVKATFFVTGAESSRNPMQLRRIIEEGHEVGNHSWSHPRMIFLSRSAIESEITRTDEVIRAAGYHGRIHFRSPFGKRFISLPLYLRETGRANIFWDLAPDSDPAVAATPEGIVDDVVSGARPGSIVLFHVMYPSRETTRQALPRVIDGLRRRGFRFVTISELLEIDVLEASQPAVPSERTPPTTPVQ
jgi:peptidoglycan-N-acetylglucosamine deacetylase